MKPIEDMTAPLDAFAIRHILRQCTLGANAKLSASRYIASVTTVASFPQITIMMTAVAAPYTCTIRVGPILPRLHVPIIISTGATIRLLPAVHTVIATRVDAVFIGSTANVTIIPFDIATRTTTVATAAACCTIYRRRPW